MVTREILLQELEDVSDPILTEVLDFVRFLKTKAAQENFSTALLTEDVLAKDWLRPEEDDAWANL